MSDKSAAPVNANAVVLRHISVAPKRPAPPLVARPKQVQVLVPVKPKQKQNNTWALSQVSDLLAPTSKKKPSIMVGGVVKILMEEKGTNSKGLKKMLCSDGSIVALRKDATVTVVDGPPPKLPSFTELRAAFVKADQEYAALLGTDYNANDPWPHSDEMDDLTFDSGGESFTETESAVGQNVPRAFTLVELLIGIGGVLIGGFILIAAVTFCIGMVGAVVDMIGLG